MNWLDLGWMKKEEQWEFHPWGPLLRGYAIPNDQYPALRFRIRWVRSSLLALALVPFLFQNVWTNFWAWVLVASFAGLLEMWAVQILCRKYPRAISLGWDKGMLYLAMWFGPKVLVVCRILTVGLLAIAIALLISDPKSLRAYLLTGAFCGVLFFLNYLQQVQRGR